MSGSGQIGNVQTGQGNRARASRIKAACIGQSMSSICRENLYCGARKVCRGAAAPRHKHERAVSGRESVPLHRPRLHTRWLRHSPSRWPPPLPACQHNSSRSSQLTSPWPYTHTPELGGQGGFPSRALGHLLSLFPSFFFCLSLSFSSRTADSMTAPEHPTDGAVFAGWKEELVAKKHGNDIECLSSVDFSIPVTPPTTQMC